MAGKASHLVAALMFQRDEFRETVYSRARFLVAAEQKKLVTISEVDLLLCLLEALWS